MNVIDNVRATARREHAAEHTREEAEAAWRAAWWDTTLALGAIPKGQRKLTGEAQRAVTEELGHSSGYLSTRATAGPAVHPP